MIYFQREERIKKKKSSIFDYSTLSITKKNERTKGHWNYWFILKIIKKFNNGYLYALGDCSFILLCITQIL